VKARTLGLFICTGAAIVIAGLVAKNFWHQSSPITDPLESLKVNGAPSFNLELMDGNLNSGKTLSLTDIHSNIIVVNFWATWCEPCIREFPSLVELAKIIHDPTKFEVIAISEDKDFGVINAFMKQKMKINSLPPNFRVLLDRNFVTAHSYGTEKLPESYIIDKNFKLVHKIISEQYWLDRDFLAWLLWAFKKRGEL
jgi:thiol-disulfide isomerase/thioredoxin